MAVAVRWPWPLCWPCCALCCCCPCRRTRACACPCIRRRTTAVLTTVGVKTQDKMNRIARRAQVKHSSVVISSNSLEGNSRIYVICLVRTVYICQQTQNFNQISRLSTKRHIQHIQYTTYDSLTFVSSGKAPLFAHFVDTNKSSCIIYYIMSRK